MPRSHPYQNPRTCPGPASSRRCSEPWDSQGPPCSLREAPRLVPGASGSGGPRSAPRRSLSSRPPPCSRARGAGKGSPRARGSSSRCCSSSPACRRPVCGPCPGRCCWSSCSPRWPSSSTRAGWRPGRVAFLPLAFLVLVVAAGRSQVRVGPQGDEPHYLMVAESLLRDGDLDLERDYAEGRYALFHDAPLLPHYRVRGQHGEIYSLHAVGLSLLILPAWALAGYAGVTVFMALALGAARAGGARVDGGADGARGRGRRRRLAARALAAASPLRGARLHGGARRPWRSPTASGARVPRASTGEGRSRSGSPSRRCPG